MSKVINLDPPKKGDVIYKRFRTDKRLWEEKIRWFWKFHYYRYSIRYDGALKTHYRLWKYPNPKYLKQAYEKEYGPYDDKDDERHSLGNPNPSGH